MPYVVDRGNFDGEEVLSSNVIACLYHYSLESLHWTAHGMHFRRYNKWARNSSWQASWRQKASLGRNRCQDQHCQRPAGGRYKYQRRVKGDLNEPNTNCRELNSTCCWQQRSRWWDREEWQYQYSHHIDEGRDTAEECLTLLRPLIFCGNLRTWSLL